MHYRNTALVTIACSASVLLGAAGTFAQDRVNDPPKGFVALFNGKDFTGWHGMPQFDPRKLAAMSEEERSPEARR